MVYNFSYEVAAVIFCILILVSIQENKLYPVDRIRTFFFFIISSMLDSTVNILFCTARNLGQEVPVWISGSLCFLFFFMEGIVYFLYFRYTLEISELGKKRALLVYGAGCIPLAVYMGMVLLSPVKHLLWSFDNGVYADGPFADLRYYYIIIFMAGDMILTLRKIERVHFRSKVIILLFSVVACMCVMFEFYHRDTVILGFLRACMIAVIYLALQSPGMYVDGVTGNGNETSFLAYVKNRMLRGKHFAVITLDIVQFNHINNILGYEKADNLLEEIGRFLKKNAQKRRAFRISGNMFSILVEDDEKGEICRRIIDSIRQRFEAPWEIDEIQMVLKNVVTVQWYPKHFKDVSSLNSLRAHLLLQAKAQGPGTVMEADARTVAEYERESHIEFALGQAIRDNRLQVYYQPVYSVEKNKVNCAEALVRLEDIDLGFIPPDEFIPLAEKKGMILALGDQVLEKVCIFIEEVLLPDPASQIECIQVNLSVIQCMQHDMADKFLRIMERHHIPHHMINFEITEMAAISASDLMQTHMKRLREEGISFSLDDYGTGNSNCSYLIQFPVQKVKFDRTMIWSYFENENAKLILDNEFQTLRGMGLPIVAEGVETLEQREQLSKIGIKYLQGYYFAKPLPEREFVNYLRTLEEEGTAQV